MEFVKGLEEVYLGLDLHEALSYVGDDLEKFGGHSMAVGVSLKKENFKKFKEDINNYIKSMEIPKVKPTINIDMEVNLKEVSVDVVKELQKLEPFGEANEMPVFMIKNLKIESIRAITRGRTLKVKAKR